MTRLTVTINDQTYAVEVDGTRAPAGEYQVCVAGEHVPVVLPDPASEWDAIEWLIVDGHPYEIWLDRDLQWIATEAGQLRLEVRDLDSRVARPLSGDGRVKAPIPGQITRLLVQPGQAVEAGQPLMVLEAMKMENEVRAPRPGVVAQVLVQPGQVVGLRQVLAEIT